MTRPVFVAAALLASAAGPALAAPGVTVQNAAARMVVIPEARNDVRVDVQRGPDGRIPTPVVRQEGDRLVVDGGLRGRIAGCGTFGADWRVFQHDRDGPNPRVQRVMIKGVGPVTLDHLPVITAHVPLHAAISADHAVFGRAGPSKSLALSNSGCGDWILGDVAGPLAVETSGSGDVKAGKVGLLHVAIAGSGDFTGADVAREASVSTHGSGDVRLGRVGGRLDAELAGSGDLVAHEVLGPIASHQSGSGDVDIQGGRAPSVAVQASGSGGFHFGGEAGAVSAESSGSADISIAHAAGPVSRSRSGSGDIDMGR